MDNKLAEARNFLDIKGLNSIRMDAKTGDATEKKAALREAAQQFEAIFMQMLLKSMRKAQAVLESDNPFNSESTKFYRDMHDQQMSIELSSNGALGLSELIVRQLGGDENFTPKSILRNDGNLDSSGTRKSFVTAFLNNDDKQTTNNFQPIKAELFAKQDNVNQNLPLEKQFKQPLDFVTALIAPAKQVEEQLGIPFKVVIAQAALETGWGQKIIKTPIGDSSNNLFNIKADSRWQGDKVTKETLEFEQGTLIKKRAPFRTYSSFAESAKDYINFLSSGDRYQDALKNTSNVEQFLHGLQKAGYATDPNYANKILGTLGKVTSLLNK
jgi:flagellar protein FlgJ